MQRIRLFSLDFWKSVFNQLGLGRRRSARVSDTAGLAHFIGTRSAHVAQSALYGYIKTRAGTRHPELFNNEMFVASLNVAKWHVWLACVSDLAVYAGRLVCRSGAHAADTSRLMQEVVETVLKANGVPAEAGSEFAAHAEQVRCRIQLTHWATHPDDSPFSESPSALVHWAPIADELKRFDEEIVRNSVRFRWQEVRRNLRSELDAAALIAAHGATIMHERRSAEV